MATAKPHLNVAVTGPTGTFGFGLIPLLEREARVQRIVGIARRPFDPSAHGWSKLEYRQGDVRDPEALKDAFEGADVIVHLAFMITGNAQPDIIRAINVEGTLNAYRAAREVGAQRFVYASSVAAYGFHPDNPVGMTEDWPTRPAERLFYAQEKAELEHLLQQEADQGAGPDLYLLRPPVVLGPHAVGGKALGPPALRRAGGVVAGALRRFSPPIAVPAPSLPLQFIHEEDVGAALVLCVLGAGPPGAYNIAGDGVLTAADVVRTAGLMPLPMPGGVVQRAARAAAMIPLPRFLPPWLEWLEAASHPAIMDTSKARRELGWEPRYSGREAVQATLNPRDD